MRRVVVTGMGAITPIGNTVSEYWSGIKQGKCGIDTITLIDTTEHKVHIAAEVKNYNQEDHFDIKEARRMDRFSQFGIIASREAALDANLNLKNENFSIDPERVGVFLSSGIGGLKTIEDQKEVVLKKGPNRVSPMFIPMAISNIAAGHVSIETGAKGESLSIITACASATHSLGEAFRTIRHGYQDAMIVGGTEAQITPLGIAGFVNMKALSISEDKSRASIPFDKKRSGFVMGEGAGVIVLEELESAKKRGAHIYAEVVGYGATSDAYHMTAPAPDGEGGARAMKNAIADANISPESITYINAHGTSTPLNDRLETLAIKRALGEHSKEVLISSTKSMTGHLLGAAGAVEAIACIKAIEDSFVPATINYKVPDEECDLNYVPNRGIQKEVKYAMSNSLGFGGHNASIIFKKYM